MKKTKRRSWVSWPDGWSDEGWSDDGWSLEPGSNLFIAMNQIWWKAKWMIMGCRFFVLDKIARKKNLRSRLALVSFLLQPKRSLAQWCAAHDSNQKSDVRIQPNLILRMQYLFPSRWIDYKVKTRSIEIVVFQHYDSRVALNVLKLSINQIDVFWVFCSTSLPLARVLDGFNQHY